MRNTRLVVAVMCSIVFGLSAFAIGWKTPVGVAHDVSTEEASPSPVVSPASGGVFNPVQPPMAGRVPLYELPFGTPDAAGNSPVVSVMEIDLGPSDGFRFHPHLGSSILVVDSGAVCIAQITLSLSAGESPASVNVVRSNLSTITDGTVCGDLKWACPTTDGHGCDFNACPDSCPINVNEMFWLGPGDKVIQSNATRHAIFNVNGTDSSRLLNTVVITSNPGSGCAGDCF